MKKVREIDMEKIILKSAKPLIFSRFCTFLYDNAAARASALTIPFFTGLALLQLKTVKTLAGYRLHKPVSTAASLPLRQYLFLSYIFQIPIQSVIRRTRDSRGSQLEESYCLLGSLPNLKWCCRPLMAGLPTKGYNQIRMAGIAL